MLIVSLFQVQAVHWMVQAVLQMRLLALWAPLTAAVKWDIGGRASFV